MKNEIDKIKEELTQRLSPEITELVEMLIDFKIVEMLDQLSKRLEVVTKP